MLTTEQRPSGLVVAREGMDEQAVGRALKRLDDRLVLQKHRRDDAADGWVWKVVCVVSESSAPVVFTWMDEQGTPRPLSHALVDAVQERMLGSRNQHESADDHNARLVESRRRDAEALSAEVVAEHRPRLERGRVTVGMGQAKPRYWKREGTRPSSSGAADHV